MSRASTAWRVAMLLLLFAGSARPLAAQETIVTPGTSVLVFAAASTSNAVREIQQRFAKTSGVQVRTSFGSSATLAQQIVHGADADLFLSADLRWADYLAEKGLVAQTQKLLGNRLVVIAPDDSKLNIRRLEDLRAAAIEHVAMGDPKSVPAGQYATQALVKLGLWEQVKSKVAAAEDVRHALAFVETGAAEAGIVYATDAAISKKVKVVVEIPESLTGPVCYPVLLLKHGRGNPAAEAFYRDLQSPEALQVFRRYGFTRLVEEKKAER
jgi:molybdate transport system substrate-binding protein